MWKFDIHTTFYPLYSFIYLLGSGVGSDKHIKCFVVLSKKMKRRIKNKQTKERKYMK